MPTLPPDQIAAIVRKADLGHKHHSRWLTPSDADKLLKAIDSGLTTIGIGGRVMQIKYESAEKVFVKPLQPGVHAPCGWFTVSLLKSIASSH